MTAQVGDEARARLLPLEGGRNFRDLGGYRAADGRTVRWGQVYRAGSTINLTDADYRHLAGRGLRVVCDFRSNEERTDEPAQWSEIAGIDYRTWDYSRDRGEEGFRSLAESLRQPGLTTENVRTIMLESYQDIVERHKDRFREVFVCLADGEVPLVFNCSAGKDRTGIAAALVLTALGVGRDDIVRDYALSERVCDFEAELLHSNLGEQARKDDLFKWVASTPVEVLRPLLRSDPAYMEHAFAYLDANHGGAMGYVRTTLGIDDAALGRIRDCLLE